MEGRRLTLGDLIPVLHDSAQIHVSEYSSTVSYTKLYNSLFTAYGDSATLELYKDRVIDEISADKDKNAICIKLAK